MCPDCNKIIDLLNEELESGNVLCSFCGCKFEICTCDECINNESSQSSLLDWFWSGVSYCIKLWR